MRAIKSNMEDQILTRDSKILYCEVCDIEYSGNRGDYWQTPEDHVFHCGECGEEMALVIKLVTTTYQE